MGDVFSTIYIFPLIIIGVIWVYDDLNHGTLAQIATLHKNRFRYFSIKIISISLYYLAIIVGYYLILSMTSFFLPDTIKSGWIQIFSVWNFRAIWIYTFTLMFWSVVGMTITYLSKSAIVGSGVLMFYLLFERVYNGATAFNFQSPLLMKMNEFLPWANFNSLIMYGAQIKTDTSQGFFSSVDSNMFELTTYMDDFLIPMPVVKPLYILVIIAILYSVIILIIYWKAFQYRIKQL